MKKVVSESQVAHLWANQVQDEARNPHKTFYFDNRTIYSYGRHFPIATIDANDSNLVFFTTRDYSNTTSKHKYTVRYAASHKTLLYCKNPFSASCGNHSENIADFEAKAKAEASKLKNARKPELYLEKIRDQRYLLEKYAKHFNINLDTCGVPLAFIWVESKDGGTKASEAELIERQKAKELADKNRAIHEAEQLALHKKRVTYWRKFQKAYYNDKATLYSRNEGIDYLRFNEKTQRIETSQGVEVPLRTGKTFYKQVLEIVKTGNCTLCGQNFMEHYEIKEINKDFVSIGCHKITIKEIKALSKKLGW